MNQPDPQLQNNKILQDIYEFKRNFYDTGIHHSITPKEKLFLDEIAFLLLPSLLDLKIEDNSPKEIEKLTSPFIKALGLGSAFIALGTIQTISALYTKDNKFDEDTVKELENKLKQVKTSEESVEGYLQKLYADPSQFNFQASDYYPLFFRFHNAKLVYEIIKYINNKYD